MRSKKMKQKNKNTSKCCKVCLITCLTVMAMTLSGCSAVIQQEETEPDILEYTVDDLPSGVYLKVEDTFYKPYNSGKTYTDVAQNSNSSRVLWYTNEKQHIPTYRNGNQIIYKNLESVPRTFTLEGFEHVGDSVGIRGITLNDAGRYSLGYASFKSGSDASVQLEEYSGKAIVLDNINGNTVNSTMINRTGSISGLELGKSYTFGFYVGTKYFEKTILADTEIYVSKSITTLNQYELTKGGYLILQMPDLLTPGYYDINNSGVVYYTGILTE